MMTAEQERQLLVIAERVAHCEQILINFEQMLEALQSSPMIGPMLATKAGR